ncbi:hypothetical protein Hdeb2414_s0260g00850761 [Helianthus debilis subsp. tardiflorus]
MSRPKAGPPLLIRIKEDQFYHGNQLARSKEVMSLYIIDLLIVLARMARTKQPRVATKEAKTCLKMTMSLKSLNSMMVI